MVRYPYEIDAHDVLIDVGDRWEQFAEECGAEGLDRRRVLNRPLWDFIAGRETKHAYELLLGRAREGGKPLVVPFRCDGPTIRRYMELDIVPRTAGQVQLVGRLLRTETRPHVALLDAERECSDEVLVICSWCKRVDAEGQWMEVEDAVSTLGLFVRTALPRLSHGICERCLANWK